MQDHSSFGLSSKKVSSSRVGPTIGSLSLSRVTRKGNAITKADTSFVATEAGGSPYSKAISLCDGSKANIAPPSEVTKRISVSTASETRQRAFKDHPKNRPLTRISDFSAHHLSKIETASSLRIISSSPISPFIESLISKAEKTLLKKDAARISRFRQRIQNQETYPASSYLHDDACR